VSWGFFIFSYRVFKKLRVFKLLAQEIVKQAMFNLIQGFCSGSDNFCQAYLD
jgi:hypothetical protein